MPNPVTGNGRYGYLAIYGSVFAQGGTEAQAKDLVTKVMTTCLCDGGGRGRHHHLHPARASATCSSPLRPRRADRERVRRRPSRGRQPDHLHRGRCARRAAGQGRRQEGIAASWPRPSTSWSRRRPRKSSRATTSVRDAAIFKKHAQRFPPIKLFSVDQLSAAGPSVSKTHFADGALYDQIMAGSNDRSVVVESPCCRAFG